MEIGGQTNERRYSIELTQAATIKKRDDRMNKPFNTTSRTLLLQKFNDLLKPADFKDYGPNGLQVEGRERISKLVSGVTASLALIDAAIEANADAIFVHHGLFWRGQDGCVTGWMKERIKRLLEHDINLFAYHLPLDAHGALGNNAQLGLHMGWGVGEPLEAKSLVFTGAVNYACAADLQQDLTRKLGRSVTCVANAASPITRLAWCTGGAQGYFQQAIDEGVDAFVTGEISEPQAHLARETGVAFFAAGHHATERYGAPAAAAFVASELDLEHVFIEVDNPA